MSICKDCGVQIGWLTAQQGRCPSCAITFRKEQFEMGQLITLTPKERQLMEAQEAEKVAQAALAKRARHTILTTETAHNLPVKDRLGIVTGEAVLGMNMFKDLMADVVGTVGGRSGTLQKGLRDARDISIEELKIEAAKLGADAVVGINLDYNDFGTTGKMLAVIASGTAVKLETGNA